MGVTTRLIPQSFTLRATAGGQPRLKCKAFVLLLTVRIKCCFNAVLLMTTNETRVLLRATM